MPSNANAKTKSVPKKPYDLRIIGAVLLLVLCIFIAGYKLSLVSDCTKQYRQDTLIQSPTGQEIAIEIVSTSAEQSKGLGKRNCIDPNWGMLFSFNQESYRDFWMKDMNFAIDIVWLDSKKTVVSVTKNVQPSSYPETFTSSQPAQYVLELPSGRADQLGFTTSAQANF